MTDNTEQEVRLSVVSVPEEEHSADAIHIQSITPFKEEYLDNSC